MSGSESRYPWRDPSPGSHSQVLAPGQLESISQTNAVSQVHHATVPPRGKQRKALLPADFGLTGGSPLRHQKKESKSCGVAASPKTKLTIYRKPTLSLNAEVLTCVHKLLHQNHVGNLLNTQIPVPPPPKGSASKGENLDFNQGPQVISRHAEAGKPLLYCFFFLPWKPQKTYRIAASSQTTGSPFQALLGLQVVSSVIQKGKPNSKQAPRWARIGLQGARGPRQNPAQSLLVHWDPRDSRPRTVTRPQSRAPGWTPAGPGLLRWSPLTPCPLPSHNGSSRQGNSRRGGGDPGPRRRLQPQVRTFSRDASMVEAAGGARRRLAVPGATSASRAPQPFPRWQRWRPRRPLLAGRRPGAAARSLHWVEKPLVSWRRGAARCASPYRWAGPSGLPYLDLPSASPNVPSGEGEDGQCSRSELFSEACCIRQNRNIQL